MWYQQGSKYWLKLIRIGLEAPVLLGTELILQHYTIKSPYIRESPSLSETEPICTELTQYHWKKIAIRELCKKQKKADGEYIIHCKKQGKKD